VPVVDASAAVEYLLGTPVGDRLAETLSAAGPVRAPHVLDVEVLSALRRLTAARVLAEDRALDALDDLVELPIERYPATALVPRMWELRSTHTAYDAAYVALAEALDVPLLTADAELARSHGHRAEITLLA
jgi:predicted nucleic acid-binding protein